MTSVKKHEAVSNELLNLKRNMPTYYAPLPYISGRSFDRREAKRRKLLEELGSESEDESSDSSIGSSSDDALSKSSSTDVNMNDQNDVYSDAMEDGESVHGPELYFDVPEEASDSFFLIDGEMELDRAVEYDKEDESDEKENFDDEDESDREEKSDAETEYDGVSSELDDISTESDSSDDYDDPNFRNDDETQKEPLYPQSPISIAESVISILEFHLRHNLSDSALSDLLRLIALHCPKPNKCVNTLYFFRKWLRGSTVNINKHFYCTECFEKLATATDECLKCKEQENEEEDGEEVNVNGEKEKTSKTSYFIEIPVEAQLQELFKRPGFYNLLRYSLERTKESEDNIEDISDGDVYKKYASGSNNIDLRSQSNISFMWNTDGVPLFKSSNIGIWPFFLKINEHPPTERNKPCNMIMAGLWFGKQKPHANLFMSPLIQTTTDLYRRIPLYVHDVNENLTIRAVIICGTCDLPAKAKFLNMKQYNGDFGCHKCLIKTEKVNGKTVYAQTTDLEMRTSAQTNEFAIRAFREKKPVYGVKGPTTLAVLVEDHIRFTVIDPMHVLAGTSKILMDLWTDSKLRKHPASLYTQRNIFNQRLCYIKPPSFVQRTPRDIADVAYWKASEHIHWLLIYSPIILSDIMTEEHFNHHLKLVVGVYLLYQGSIPTNDVEIASELLQSYVSEFADIYDHEFLSNIIHCFLHLCQQVRDYGPLRIFSCFPFENANGKLTSMLHATRDAQLQICKGVSSYLQLAALKKKHLETASAIDFCSKLENSGTHRCKILATIDNVHLIERPKKFKTVPKLIDQALQNVGVVGKSVYEFKRVLINGRIYSSKSYTRSKKTDSTCVEFINDDKKEVGLIKVFVRVADCLCADSLCDDCKVSAKTFAIMIDCETSNPFKISQSRPDETLKPPTIVRHIFKLRCNEPESVHVVDISRLRTLYFVIELPNQESIYAVKSIIL